MILAIVALIVSLDQLTKVLVTRTLALHQSVPVIKGVFHITLINNPGAAFGLLKQQTALFIFTSILAIIMIFNSLKGTKRKPLSIYNFSLTLILAGAIGNLIDRLFFGYVIDFLDLRVWPVFNIADSAITIGAILLGWSILRSKNASNHL